LGCQQNVQARQCLRHDADLGLNILDYLHGRAVIHLGDRVRVDRFEVEYLRVKAGGFRFQVARSLVLLRRRTSPSAIAKKPPVRCCSSSSGTCVLILGETVLSMLAFHFFTLSLAVISWSSAVAFSDSSSAPFAPLNVRILVSAWSNRLTQIPLLKSQFDQCLAAIALAQARFPTLFTSTSAN
jgi:hypothetical protein